MPSTPFLHSWQVALGRELPAQQLLDMNKLFIRTVNGLFALPFVDLPFMPFGQALRCGLVVMRADGHLAAG